MGKELRIKPHLNYVVVDIQKEGSKSEGGIFIPEIARQMPTQGKVLAVGPGRITESGTRIPIGIDVGDTIIYEGYAGTKITHEGKDYLIIRDVDIKAIIPPQPEENVEEKKETA